MNKPLLKSARPWLDCLREEQGLKSILDRAKTHENLTEQLKIVLKKLGFHEMGALVQVEWHSINPNELFLLVPSPTIGARLQQMTPSLLAELNLQKWSVSNIKIKVRPHLWSSRSGVHRTEPPPFTGAAHEAWQKLYERLSPNSSIREAVGQLLKGRQTKR